MSWAAANVPRRRRSSLEGEVGVGGSGGDEDNYNSNIDNNRNDNNGSGILCANNNNNGSSSNNNNNNNHNRSLVEGRTRTRTKRGETVEAVLSRLSKAYSVSMECLGSLHQLEESYNKIKIKNAATSSNNNNDSANSSSSSSKDDGDATEEKKRSLQQSMQKVAVACRQTLETAVLMDPLIVAPTLRHTMQQFAHRDQNNNNNITTTTTTNFAAGGGGGSGGDTTTSSTTTSSSRWIYLCKPRPEPPQINSKSHKSTIRQISYLALTNYADLLMSCSSFGGGGSSSQNSQQQQQLLDRGVVKKLRGFADDYEKSSINTTTLWGGGVCESEEDLQRLALVALCDASAIDGSDPVLWLKLACAARSMGRIKYYHQQQRSATKTKTTDIDDVDVVRTPPFYPILSPYRRLERHALESGYQCLPSNVPPNRAITKSLQELNDDQYPMEYDSITPLIITAAQQQQQQRQQSKLCLDMTRYSWSLLGRLLMKAYRGEGREGTTTTKISTSAAAAAAATTTNSTNAILAFGQNNNNNIGSSSGSYPSIISLSISPMLLLPSSVLARILSFMETQSIWNFEATCRALSVSIMSVRATLEKQQQQQQQQQHSGIVVVVPHHHHHQQRKEEEEEELQQQEKMISSSSSPPTPPPPPPPTPAAGAKVSTPPQLPETQVDDPMDIDTNEEEKEKEKQQVTQATTGDKSPHVTSSTSATFNTTSGSDQQQKDGEKEEESGNGTATDTTPLSAAINVSGDTTTTTETTTTLADAGGSKTATSGAVAGAGANANAGEEQKQQPPKEENATAEPPKKEEEKAQEGTTTTAAENLPLLSAIESEEHSPALADISEEQKEGTNNLSTVQETGEASAKHQKEGENDATAVSATERETNEDKVQEGTAEGPPVQVSNDTEPSKGENGTTESNKEDEIPNERSADGEKTTTEQKEEGENTKEEEGENANEQKDGENTSTQPTADGDDVAAPTPAPPPASGPATAPTRGRGRTRPRSASLEPFRVSSRSSKRVRSQQFISDKKDEKLRKRRSVEFCLRASILGTVADKDAESNHNSKTDDKLISVEWDTVRGSSWQLPAVFDSKNANGAAGPKGKTSSTEGARQRFEAEERISPSSLTSFLHRMSSENAGPGVLLEQYLGHVALHVEEVFSVDPGDTVVLTSSLLESLELLMEQKSYHKLLPQFFDHEDLSNHSIHRSLELFAIDLLNVELRFKACERQQSFSISYDDDINFVCSMIPVLLGGMADLDEELEKSKSKGREWIKLKTRVNWLAAGVYLWRSRLTRSVCESIEAEELGMKFIDSTIACVRDQNISVATPHLQSRLRSGPHWRNLCKETLFSYRDEIQASSVVSHAQQQFQDRVAKVFKRSNDMEAEEAELIEEDISALSGIGQQLLTRYKAPFGSEESKHGELLDDFMSIHGDECLPGPGDAVPSVEKMDAALPVSAFNVSVCGEMTSTSILTILVACLQVKSSNHKTMVVLLLRLLLTALNRHEQICRSASQDQSPDNLSDSEDADSIENDAASDLDLGENGNSSKNDAIKLGRLINYLLERTLKSMSHLASEEDKDEIATSDEFLQVIHHSLGFSSCWFSHFSQRPNALEEVLDQKVFMSTCALLHACVEGSKTSKFTSLKELHIGGLVRIIDSQQAAFASLVRVQGTIRARRAVRLRICILRAEFIATALCEVSKVLSENLFTIKEGIMMRSEVLKAPIFETTSNSAGAPSAPQPFQIQILCEALLWFSQYSKEAEENATNSFDRPILERLRVPLVAAIVSFCGSCSESRSDDSKVTDIRSPKDSLSLRDFLDSDASAHGYSDQEEEKKEGSRKELLRVLCHIVHCIGLVFGKLDEKEVASFDGSGLYSTVHGPLLPLVATRVLNHVADTLLCEFADDESESDAQGLWALKYPFGTGAIGYLVDSALYKAYKCLHGFTLTSSNDFYSGKEIVPVSSTDLDIKKQYPPESHHAAAQLYRCIVRAGKKTPPKAALETVSSALPPLKESRKSRRISDFLFSNDAKGFGVDDIMSIATESQGWTKLFEMVKKWDDVQAPGDQLVDEAHGRQADLSTADGDLPGNCDKETGMQGIHAKEAGDRSNDDTGKEGSNMTDDGARRKNTASVSPDKQGDTREAADGEDTNDKHIDNKPTDDEVMFLRKGVFSMLAQGDLPKFSNDVGGKEDDRAGAKRFEEELSKKFIAIFNTLKYGDTNDLRGWFRAAQCLMFKADVIAERLGMSNGFSRSKNFHIPEQRVPAVSRLSIAALEEKQDKESAVRTLGWIQYLGDDLSLYIEHQWSSFESLKKLSNEILTTSETCGSSGEAEVDAFMAQVKKEIHGMQQKGRPTEWQQAWGGMFVAALKKMAIRCLSLAVYLFHENASIMKTEDRDLMPEIMETMGLILYSGLLGGQTYGYPMHSTTTKRKRQNADASRSCFQRAIDLARSAEDGMDADTWDLIFMIGKCHEKIAGTYKLEIFQNSQPTPDSKSIRLFEQHMNKALDCYRASLDEKPDVDIEAGGSSHGPTEIFYRLHASRLKCLLESAMAMENERGAAEEEALRLTEKHWFSPPTDPLEKTSVRDRIWNVLADIVSALAKCRLEHAFFHRSVYRHAQALMWAPVLCDPVGGRVEGSKSTVPATRSFQIRSLNHATSAARSALAVMTSLFEKKRSQLCAVWVTTTYPPTAFETLNNSARKYDSLRGKYISAYIDCHRLCGNRNELETLLRWLSSSKRDLPSLYQSSAKTEGGKPDKSHNHDSLLVKTSTVSSFNLLTGLKRQANSAMAHVLTDELSSEDSNVRKSVENHLKLAYACFLRMNCSVKDLKKTRAWKYGPQGVWEAEAVCKAFLKLDEREKVQMDPNDWSGGGQKAAVLDAALRKCKEVFPSVTANYYSKKTNQKVKSQEEAESKDSNKKPSSQLSGHKRSFEVKVPDGLAEGETFTTTIKSGENAKKVKLTVPSGKPRMLRFSLDLSTQTHD